MAQDDGKVVVWLYFRNSDKDKDKTSTSSSVVPKDWAVVMDYMCTDDPSEVSHSILYEAVRVNEGENGNDLLVARALIGKNQQSKWAKLPGFEKHKLGLFKIDEEQVEAFYNDFNKQKIKYVLDKYNSQMFVEEMLAKFSIDLAKALDVGKHVVWLYSRNLVKDKTCQSTFTSSSLNPKPFKHWAVVIDYMSTDDPNEISHSILYEAVSILYEAVREKEGESENGLLVARDLPHGKYQESMWAKLPGFKKSKLGMFKIDEKDVQAFCKDFNEQKKKYVLTKNNCQMFVKEMLANFSINLDRDVVWLYCRNLDKNKDKSSLSTFTSSSHNPKAFKHWAIVADYVCDNDPNEISHSILYEAVKGEEDENGLLVAKVVTHGMNQESEWAEYPGFEKKKLDKVRISAEVAQSYCNDFNKRKLKYVLTKDNCQMFVDDFLAEVSISSAIRENLPVNGEKAASWFCSASRSSSQALTSLVSLKVIQGALKNRDVVKKGAFTFMDVFKLFNGSTWNRKSLLENPILKECVANKGMELVINEVAENWINASRGAFTWWNLLQFPVEIIVDYLMKSQGFTDLQAYGGKKLASCLTAAGVGFVVGGPFGTLGSLAYWIAGEIVAMLITYLLADILGKSQSWELAKSIFNYIGMKLKSGLYTITNFLISEVKEGTLLFKNICNKLGNCCWSLFSKGLERLVECLESEEMEEVLKMVRENLIKASRGAVTMWNRLQFPVVWIVGYLIKSTGLSGLQAYGVKKLASFLTTVEIGSVVGGPYGTIVSAIFWIAAEILAMLVITYDEYQIDTLDEYHTWELANDIYNWITCNLPNYDRLIQEMIEKLMSREDLHPHAQWRL